jgi:hypothetical protein
MQLSDLSTVSIRAAFRFLLNSGKATVPPEVRGEKTAARWIASASWDQVVQLAHQQSIADTLLEVANHQASETPSEPSPTPSEPSPVDVPSVVPSVTDSSGMIEVIGDGPGRALAEIIRPNLKVAVSQADIDALVRKAVAAALDGSEPRTLDPSRSRGLG